jgi:hypothetical protein
MDPKEMEALVREAGAIDAGATAYADAAASGQLDDKGQIVTPDPVAQAADAAEEWVLIPKTLAWAITAVFPELAPHYTDDKCMELAHAIVPVAEKYGWSGVGNSPELGLVMAGAFFCLPAYQAHKHRQAERAKKKKEVEQPRAAGEPLVQAINGSEG